MTPQSFQIGLLEKYPYKLLSGSVKTIIQVLSLILDNLLTRVEQHLMSLASLLLGYPDCRWEGMEEGSLLSVNFLGGLLWATPWQGLGRKVRQVSCTCSSLFSAAPTPHPPPPPPSPPPLACGLRVWKEAMPSNLTSGNWIQKLANES